MQLVGNINLMMTDSESYLLHLKALSLARFLMHGIQKSSLQGEILELGTHTEFLKALYKAVIYHASKEIRTLVNDHS